jgi:beta-glucanase (GH16 family)
MGPKTMAIYIDGRLIASQPTPSNLHTPMYLIANLAVGGKWVESPDGTTYFPATMKIDYIRAWEYEPWVPNGQ